MSRLDEIEWGKVSANLQYTIYGCPLGTHRDLLRLWCNLSEIAKEISRAEVVERRTMGSPGRYADEKLQELLDGIVHIDQMILLAHLQCG